MHVIITVFCVTLGILVTVVSCGILQLLFSNSGHVLFSKYQRPQFYW